MYYNNLQIKLFQMMKGLYIFSAYNDEYLKEIRFLFFIYNKSNLNRSMLIDHISFNKIKIINKNIINIDKYYFFSIIKYKNKKINNKITYFNNVIELTNIYKNKKYENVLCLTTFINNYKEREFYLFIKHYIKLGINLFVIYKTSCNKEIEIIINKYYLKGIITIIKDNYTYKSNIFEYDYHLQVLKHNDCYFRYKYLASHILFVDQDELLITNSKSLLNIELNKSNDIYYFFAILIIENGSVYSISKCPKNKWKFIIYNTKCVDFIDIHRVFIKKNCNSSVSNYSNAYVLHNRNTYPYPWYINRCKFISISKPNFSYSNIYKYNIQ